MTYDAILTARRGMDPDQLALATPAFGAAVRHAVFAERLAGPLEDAQTIAASPVPRGLSATDQAKIGSEKVAAAGRAAEIYAALFPEG